MKEEAAASAHHDASTDATPKASASAPVNGTPIPAASIEAYVNPKRLPPYQGPTGSVEGTISITGDPAPNVPGLDFSSCPGGAKVYGKLFREGAPIEGGGRALADAIVGVTDYSDFYVPESSEVKTITIEDCAMPRVIVTTVGQRLEITNMTDQLWAPTIEQAGLPALMVAPPKGNGVIKLYPPHPGHLTLMDRMAHTYARTDLWVLMYPSHAVSGLDGHYRIDGLPIGKMSISTRLPAISQQASKPIEVLAGVVVKVDLTLNYVTPKPVDAGKPPKFGSVPM